MSEQFQGNGASQVAKLVNKILIRHIRPGQYSEARDDLLELASVAAKAGSLMMQQTVEDELRKGTLAITCNLN